MGNCLVSYKEEEKAEEAKHLVISTVHDKVEVGDNCCKKIKKVRFNVQSDNAAEAATETTTIMRPPRMKKGVRVKVVLTQSELKQILNRTTIYHHHLPPSPPPPSSVDHIPGQIRGECRISRRSSLCSWNPALHTIPEWSHY